MLVFELLNELPSSFLSQPQRCVNKQWQHSMMCVQCDVQGNNAARVALYLFQQTYGMQCLCNVTNGVSDQHRLSPLCLLSWRNQFIPPLEVTQRSDLTKGSIFYIQKFTHNSTKLEKCSLGQFCECMNGQLCKNDVATFAFRFCSFLHTSFGVFSNLSPLWKCCEQP